MTTTRTDDSAPTPEASPALGPALVPALAPTGTDDPAPTPGAQPHLVDTDPAAPPSTAASRGTLWRNHDYVAWLVADTSWQFGASIRAFAMTLVTYAVTGSYAQAGMVATVSTLATVVSMLPGGVLVDRWDRRTSLVVSGLARAVVYAAAAVAWWTGILDLAGLVAVGVASGIIGGLFTTATDAALKSVVPSRDLSAAVAANQGRDAAVTLSASPLSGLLMGVSYALPFAAAAVGAVLQVLVTGLIRTDLRPPAPDAGPVGTAATASPSPATASPATAETAGPATAATAPSAVSPAPATGRHRPDAPVGPSPSRLRRAGEEALTGFRFLWRNTMLRRMLPALLLVNAGMVALETGLTLVFQSQGIQPWRIGLLDTAAAVGMLIGAVFAQRLVTRIPTGRLVVTSFLVVVAVVLPVALVPRMDVALVSMLLVGLPIPALNGAMGGYFQALIPASLQGRVLASFGLIAGVLPGLMPGAVGVALEHWSPGVTIGATAFLFVAAGVAVALNRELRDLPVPADWGIDEAAAAGAPAA